MNITQRDQWLGPRFRLGLGVGAQSGLVPGHGEMSRGGSRLEYRLRVRVRVKG